MSSKRASIFDSDEEPLDLSGFAPRPAPAAAAPPPEAVRAVAETARFRSREAATPRAEAPPKSPRRPRRQYRTGRNEQFNIKASPETIAAFIAICEAKNWVLGETLARAVAALQKQLADEDRGP